MIRRPLRGGGDLGGGQQGLAVQRAASSRSGRLPSDAAAGRAIGATLRTSASRFSPATGLSTRPGRD